MSDESIRIDTFLANHGFCARRKVADFLMKHNVLQSGKKIKEHGERIDPAIAVYVDGKAVTQIEYYYIALHKPIRYLCSNSDDEGRDLAISLIPLADKVRLYNVGRLDYFSEGLIFFTNDGAFTKKLTHPSYEVEKEYEVTLERRLTEAEKRDISHEFWVDATPYRLEKVRWVSDTTYTLVLKEGKNREIRRVFAFLDIKILQLKRIRIGSVRLGDLALGQYRSLRPTEIKLLMD